MELAFREPISAYEIDAAPTKRACPANVGASSDPEDYEPCGQTMEKRGDSYYCPTHKEMH